MAQQVEAKLALDDELEDGLPQEEELVEGLDGVVDVELVEGVCFRRRLH